MLHQKKVKRRTKQSKPGSRLGYLEVKNTRVILLYVCTLLKCVQSACSRTYFTYNFADTRMQSQGEVLNKVTLQEEF